MNATNLAPTLSTTARNQAGADLQDALHHARFAAGLESSIGGRGEPTRSEAFFYAKKCARAAGLKARYVHTLRDAASLVEQVRAYTRANGIDAYSGECFFCWAPLASDMNGIAK